jgi:hypothetical protein
MVFLNLVVSVLLIVVLVAAFRGVHPHSSRYGSLLPLPPLLSCPKLSRPVARLVCLVLKG